MTISQDNLALTTVNTIVLDGQFTDWHVRQEKDRTVVWRHATWSANSPVIELTMPQKQYSIDHDAPQCGHGKTEFYQDFKKALEEHKKASA